MKWDAFSYDRRLEKLRLWVNSNLVGSFPLTYTIKECLEDWCGDYGLLLVDIRMSIYYHPNDLWG